MCVILLSLESKEIKINTRKRPGDRPFLVLIRKLRLFKGVDGLFDLVEGLSSWDKFGLTGFGIKNDGAGSTSDASSFSS